MPSKSEEFAWKFNQLLAPSGKTARPITAQDLEMLKNLDLSKANPIRAKTALKKSSTGSSKTKTTATKAQPAVNADLTSTELFKQVVDADRSGWSLPKPLTTGLNWLFVKPLEQLTRVPKTVFGAAAEAGKAVNAGEPIWSLADDAAYGAQRGGLLNKDYSYKSVVDQIANFTKGDGTPRALKELGPLGTLAKQQSYAVNALRDAPPINIKPFDNLIPDALPEAASHFGPLNKVIGGVLGKANNWDPNILHAPEYATNLVGEVGFDPTSYVGGLSKTAIGEEAAAELYGKFGDDLGKMGINSLEELKALPAEQAHQLVADLASRSATRESVLNEVGRPLERRAGRFVSRAQSLEEKEHAIAQFARDSAERQVIEVGGGGKQGHLLSLKNPEQVAAQADQAASEFGRQLIDPVHAMLDNYRAGKYTVKQLEALERDYPAFKAARKIITGTKGVGDDVVWNAARDSVMENAQKDISKFRADYMAVADDRLKNIPTLKFAGKQVLEMPKLGELTTKIGGRLNQVEKLQSLRKAFSFSANAPGQMENVISKAANKGVPEFERKVKEMDQLAEHLGLNQAERKLVGDAQFDGNVLTGNHKVLEDYLKAERESVYQREYGEGLRNSDAQHPWVEVKGGSRKTRKAFYREREKALKALKPGETYNAPEIARAMGLTPETDPLSNQIYRNIRSSKDLTKQYINRDMLGLYGVKGNYSTATAGSMNLKELPTNNTALGNLVKEMTKDFKQGEKMYVNKDIWDFVDKYHKIGTNLATDEEKDLLHIVDYVTNKWKVLNTVYGPGFHVRNFMSDIIIGNMDGVGLRDYKQAFDGFLRRNSAKIEIGGEQIPYNKLLDDFGHAASSGSYHEAELGTALKEAGTNPVSRVNQAIKSGASKREDLGRFAHYIHVMKEETQKYVDRGYSFEKAYAKANENAIYRVNKYKFNYSALTDFERRKMRRIFPFYTYLRKASPLIMESLLLTPRNLVGFEKFREASNRGKDLTYLPTFMREMGYANAGDTGYGITDDWLPQATIASAISNPAAKLNPLAQIGIEASIGKTLYSGKNLGSKNFLKNIFTSGELYKSKFNYADKIEKVTGASASKAPGAEQLLNYLGIPVRALTPGRQNQRVKELKTQMENEFQSINNGVLKDSGLHVYWSDSPSDPGIRVADENGDVKYRYTNYEEFKKSLG